MVLEGKEVGFVAPFQERLENERELWLSAGCSLRTGKGLHQYKTIVKNFSNGKKIETYCNRWFSPTLGFQLISGVPWCDYLFFMFLFIIMHKLIINI